ncbi:MAG: hypothetical protein LBK28_07680 [Propionibacteriaceae bacterium]|jgi:hypothetical protein|nr:hypothetical protein [Propionibacteriaceae bacterium]
MQAETDYVRKSFTIPFELWTQVEGFAGRGQQSTYVSQALRRQVERDNLAALIQEMEEANGPVPMDVVEKRARELA